MPLAPAQYLDKCFEEYKAQPDNVNQRMLIKAIETYQDVWIQIAVDRMEESKDDER
jgi:hypothetical protein